MGFVVKTVPSDRFPPVLAVCVCLSRAGWEEGSVPGGADILRPCGDGDGQPAEEGHTPTTPGAGCNPTPYPGGNYPALPRPHRLTPPPAISLQIRGGHLVRRPQGHH